MSFTVFFNGTSFYICCLQQKELIVIRSNINSLPLIFSLSHLPPLHPSHPSLHLLSFPLQASSPFPFCLISKMSCFLSPQSVLPHFFCSLLPPIYILSFFSDLAMNATNANIFIIHQKTHVEDSTTPRMRICFVICKLIWYQYGKM